MKKLRQENVGQDKEMSKTHSWNKTKNANRCAMLIVKHSRDQPTVMKVRWRTRKGCKENIQQKEKTQ